MPRGFPSCSSAFRANQVESDTRLLLHIVNALFGVVNQGACNSVLKLLPEDYIDTSKQQE